MATFPRRSDGEVLTAAQLNSYLDEIEQTEAELATHIGNVTNPHSVTKTQVGLGSVDNTSDLDKPISTATQSALNAKANASHTHAVADMTATGTRSASTYLRGDNTWATPPNTTYAAMTQTEANAGTATTSRAITAAVLKAAIEFHAPEPTSVIAHTHPYTELTPNGIQSTSTYKALVAASTDGLSMSMVALPLNMLLDVQDTNPSTGHILRHDGTEYVNVMGTDHFVGKEWLVVKALLGSSTNTASTTGLPLTALSFPLPANSVWTIDLEITDVIVMGAGGLKLRFDVPSGSTIKIVSFGPTTTTGVTSRVIYTVSGQVGSTAHINYEWGREGIRTTGIIRVGATAGTFTPYVASGTGSEVSIYADTTFLTARRVS